MICSDGKHSDIVEASSVSDVVEAACSSQALPLVNVFTEQQLQDRDLDNTTAQSAAVASHVNAEQQGSVVSFSEYHTE